MEIEEINRYITDLEDKKERNLSDANEAGREITKQLNLIASAFFSFSAIFFSLNTAITNSSIYIKFFIFTSWICFFLVLIFGSLQLGTDYSYFICLAKKITAIIASLAKGDIKTTEDLNNAYKKLNKDIPFESSSFFLKLQFTFLILGAILLFSAFGIPLFR